MVLFREAADLAEFSGRTTWKNTTRAHLNPPRLTFQTFFALRPSILNLAASVRFLVMILSHKTTELSVFDRGEESCCYDQTTQYAMTSSYGTHRLGRTVPIGYDADI